MPTLTVTKWRFVDPATGDTYTFEINPNEMGSLHPTRSIQTMTSTAPKGQVLMFEAATPATTWSFKGTLLHKTQYDALVEWCYRKRNRLYVYDHFGRRITCVLTGVEMTPRRTQRHYWRHDYSVNAIVVAVGTPSVGEKWGS